MSLLLLLSAALAAGEAEAAEHRHEQPAPALRLEQGEAEVLRVLGDLASPQPDILERGIAAAQASRRVFYDAPLRHLLRSDLPSSVLAAAATALAELDWPVEADDLQQRIQALGRLAFSEDDVVRRAAIMALGRFPTPQAQQLLTLKLEGSQGEERETVGSALARMREPEVLARISAWLGRGQRHAERHGVPLTWTTVLASHRLLADPRAADTLATVELLSRADDPASVRHLVAYVARKGLPESQRAALRLMQAQPLPVDVPHLVSLLSNPSSDIRRAAIDGLATHRSKKVTAALATHLLAEESEYLQKAIGAALREQPTEPLAAALTPVLQSGAGYPRDLAVFLIRERQGVETIWPKVLALAIAADDAGRDSLLAEDLRARRDILLPKLTSELMAAERAAVLIGLSGIKDRQAGSLVLSEIHAKADPAVLRAAGEALAAQPDERVVPRLTRTLAKAEASVREVLYALLLSRASKAALAAVAKGIRADADPGLVARLIRLVAGRQEPSLIAATAGRLTVEQPPVVQAAAMATLRSVDDPTLAQRYTKVVRAAPSDSTFDSTVSGGALDLSALDSIEDAAPLVGGSDPAAAAASLIAYARLAAMPAPTGTNAVRELAGDPSLPTGLRLRAIHDLGASGDAGDLKSLERMVDEEDAEVRSAARHAMHAMAPELYPLSDEYGRYPLVAVSGLAGTSLLLMSTRIAERLTDTNPNDTLIGGAGAALGLSSAWLLTIDADVSLADAGAFATLGTWGTAGGYSLARLTGIRGENDTGPLWAAISGEVLGVTAGALAARFAHLSGGDVALTNAAAASWGVGAMSLAYLSRAGSNQATAADVFAVGGAVAIVPMALLADRLQLDSNTLIGVATTAGLASWVGAFAPYAIVPEHDRRDLDVLAGIGLGQALGLTGGLILSRVTTFELETITWAGVGALSGAGLGLGLGLSHSTFNGRPTFALLEAGTLAGGGLLAWLGPRMEFSGTDVALISMMTAGGAATGARFPEKVAEGSEVPGVDENAPESELWGGALLGATLGFYTGLAASQFVELSPGEVVMAGAGAAVLGTGGAGTVLLYPELGRENFSPAFAAGATIGVVGLGAYLAPKLRYEPADISLGVSAGALGAFLGSWIPAYDTAEGRPLPDARQWGGGMLGGALGLVFAGTVSQFQDVDPRRVLRVDLGTLGGMAIGSGVGMLTPVSLTPDYDRRLTVGLMHAGAATGFAVASVIERKRIYTWADRAHIGLGSVLGAWHGSLIPYLWREEPADGSDSVPDSEVWGGLLVGAGLGYYAARTSLRFGQKDGEDLGEILLMDGLGTALGAGIWTLADTDRRLRFGVLEGAGLAAWLTGELLATRSEYSISDRVLVSALTLAGAIGGAGLPYLLYDRKPTEQELWGGAALGAGALGLSSLGLAQVSEYDRDQTIHVLGTAALGAATMWGIGQARIGTGKGDRLALGDLGLFAGLGVGLVAAPWIELSKDDLGWMVVSSGLGAWVGSRAPVQQYGRRAREENMQGGALAGAAIGSLAMAGIGQLVEWDVEDAIEASSVSLAATMVAGGLGMLEVPRKPRHEALSLQLAAAGGFLAGGLLAPLTDVESDTVLTAGTLALVGAWQGVLAPRALDLATQEEGGGALAGSGAGWLLGYGLGQALELEPGQNVEMIAGSGIGSLISAGLGMMLAWGERQTAGSVELGSLAGTALGLGASYLTAYEASDAGLIASAGAWGAWHGVWLGDTFVPAGKDGTASKRRGGGALLGLGLGLAGGMAASQFVEVRGGDITEATLTMSAGNMAGVGLGKLLRLDDDVQTAMLEVGGLGALIAGVVLAEQTRFSATDTVLVGLSSLIGVSHGAMLHGIFESDELEPDAVWGGMLLGGGVAMAGSMALAQRVDLEMVDLIEVAVATVAGDAIGFGIGYWLELERQAHLALVEVGGLGMTGLALWLAESTVYERSDRLLLVYGAGWGAWLGGWAPQMWLSEEDGSHNAVGVLLGASAGTLIAAHASQALDMPAADVGETAFGTLMTSILGAGTGLILQPDSDLWVTLMEATSVAGTVAIGLAAPHTRYAKGDAVLGSLAALYGLYQGAGLSYLADADDRQVAGAMMAAGAAGALTAAYLGPYINLTGTDVLMLLAGSAWGVWTGIWTAAAIDEMEEEAIDRSVFFLGVGTSAILTDVALVLTSVAISELVEMPPQQFAWISVGGGVGLVGGLLATALSGKSPKLGIAAGSVAGLAAGTLVTGLFDWQPANDSLAIRTDSRGSSSELWPTIESWFPAVGALPIGDLDPLAPARGTQLMVSVSGTYR